MYLFSKEIPGQVIPSEATLERMREINHLVVAMIPDKQVVGAGIMRAYDTSFMLIDIAASSRYPRQGIGSAVLQRCEEIAVDLGGTEVRGIALDEGLEFFLAHNYRETKDSFIVKELTAGTPQS